MTQLEKKKFEAIDSLKQLCARCSADVEHSCRVTRLIGEIRELNGIPVIVNDQLKHVVFN